MMTGQWGLSRNLQAVHYFDKDGHSLCEDEHSRHVKLKYPRPDWKPEYPRTCKACRELKKIMEIEQRGKIIQSTLSTKPAKSANS
jgi:hypothetical protein